MLRKIGLIFVVLMLAVQGTGNTQELLKRAPGVLPGTPPQWRTPDYWISRMASPDEVILTPEEIAQRNARYLEKVASPDPFAGAGKDRTPNLSHWWPGWVLDAPDLFSMAPSSVADSVRSRIQIQIDYLTGKPFGNVNAVEYSPADIEGFLHEMALDEVPRTVEPEHGMAVRTTRLRNVPSFAPNEIGLLQANARRYDMFNVCLVHIGEPVTVVYQSRTGEYLLVLTKDAWGWVRSGDIALASKETIGRFVNAERFVVCTGDKVVFYSDSTCTHAAGWFGMGDRLIAPNSNLPGHVKIPVRMTSGRLIYESAFLAPDADVHKEYLPYTRRNIVTTAFKLMDNFYDFTNGHYGRNHETTYRDIFACFGFKLPWHGGLFTHYGTDTAVAIADPDNNNKGQFAAILDHDPFTTLFATSSGHPQLLLGERDNVPIVFDHNGYEYTDENGVLRVVRRTCVGTMTTPGITAYMLRRPLTFLELK